MDANEDYEHNEILHLGHKLKYSNKSCIAVLPCTVTVVVVKHFCKYRENIITETLHI